MSGIDVTGAGGSIEGSTLLRGGFVALTLLLAGLLVGAVYWSALRTRVGRRAALGQAGVAALLSGVWIAVTGMAAARGALRFSAPPSMLAVFPLVFALAVGLALSPVGKRIALSLPVAALVGYQGFRVVVELLLHRAYTEGLMPVQMSYAGRNFDIITGITAIGLGTWLATGRRSARLVFLWNTLGVLLLANILGVALLSAPTPMRVFMNEPANVWVTQAPWIWLPTVMVLAAIVGHVLVYRRLLSESRAPIRVNASRVAVALVIVLAMALQACTNASEPVTPETKPGVLAGTVTLLGSDGPPSPAGVGITLYGTLGELETHAGRYTASLQRIPGDARSYDYTFTTVAPGAYYVLACFEFGCAPYRNSATGALLRVFVQSEQMTVLHFGI